MNYKKAQLCGKDNHLNPIKMTNSGVAKQNLNNPLHTNKGKLYQKLKKYLKYVLKVL